MTRSNGQAAITPIRTLWTPAPWEVRHYETDSAEYEDGFRVWIANHRRKEFIADVLDARNGPIVAKAPELVAVARDVVALLPPQASPTDIVVPAAIVERAYRLCWELDK